jgi:hypothetical protein
MNNTTKKGNGGSPGAPAFQLGDKTKYQKKEETEVIEINDNEGLKVGVEVKLEDLLREELISRLQRLLFLLNQRVWHP